MRLERTHDMTLVRRIVRDPAIWPHIHDDGAADWEPVDHDAMHWMLVSDPEPVGVFLVHAQNSTTCEMHTCLLPCIWGVKAGAAAQMLAAWVFRETNWRKLNTRVPAYNRLALRFARAGGMTQEGVDRASFLRNGELIDQIMLGITKEEWLCQQQSR